MTKVSGLCPELMLSHSLKQGPWIGTSFGNKIMDSVLDVLTLEYPVRNTNELLRKMSDI